MLISCHITFRACHTFDELETILITLSLTCATLRGGVYNLVRMGKTGEGGALYDFNYFDVLVLWI